MATRATSHLSDDATPSFDVELVDAIGEHVGRDATELPTIGDQIDLEAITAVVQAETRTRLAFDVEIPGAGMGPDGEPATTVTVILETEADDPVHVVVTDENPDSGGVGASPRIW